MADYRYYTGEKKKNRLLHKFKRAAIVLSVAAVTGTAVFKYCSRPEHIKVSHKEAIRQFVSEGIDNNRKEFEKNNGILLSMQQCMMEYTHPARIAAEAAEASGKHRKKYQCEPFTKREKDSLRATFFLNKALLAEKEYRRMTRLYPNGRIPEFEQFRADLEQNRKELGTANYTKFMNESREREYRILKFPHDESLRAIDSLVSITGQYNDTEIEINYIHYTEYKTQRKTHKTITVDKKTPFKTGIVYLGTPKMQAP